MNDDKVENDGVEFSSDETESDQDQPWLINDESLDLTRKLAVSMPSWTQFFAGS